MASKTVGIDELMELFLIGNIVGRTRIEHRMSFHIDSTAYI